MLSAIDALIIINWLNANGATPISALPPDYPPPYMDVDGDGRISPSDALRVINCLNRQTEGVTCKYARLNYLGEKDHIRIWESIFKDSSGTGRAGKVFDFTSTSSIKSACLRKNIEAAALACVVTVGVTGGQGKKAEDIGVGSNHDGLAMSSGGTYLGSDFSTAEKAAREFCRGLVGKDLDTCIRVRQANSECKPGAVEYFMANRNGRTFEQLRQQDPQFASMCYIQNPSLDDCLHRLLITDEDQKRKRDIDFDYVRYREALLSSGAKELDNSAVRAKDATYVHQNGETVGKGSNNNGDFSITRVYDENCRALSQAELANIDPATICDNVNMRALISPISLHWSPSGEAAESYSITSFPLENMPGKYYLWRGSREMPLLVYDPSHAGIITSASQLFGSWTFGGKGKLASVASMSATNTAWEHGYEALATLDHDKNGIVDGNELADLSLWFDENQNGVSEQGEVKPVREMGLTKLFYGPIVKDVDGRSVRVKLGFERTQDTKVVTGESVDWYSDSYESRAEAVMNFEANRQLSGSLSSALRSLQEASAQKSKEPAHNTSVAAAPPVIRGVWEWQADEIEQAEGANKSALLSGFFHFHPTEAGINGVSLLEIPVEITHKEKGALPARSLANAVPFIVNDVKTTATGAEMTFLGNIMGVASTAHVTLTVDPTTNVATLNGVTQSVYKNPTTGKEAALRYSWTAKPYVMNAPGK